MRKLLFILLILGFCLILCSCSNSKKLIGEWTFDDGYIEFYDNGKYDCSSISICSFPVSYKVSGDHITFNYDAGYENAVFKYTIKGDNLIMTDNDYPDDPISFQKEK